eukprot:Awhi_evm1s2702
MVVGKGDENGGVPDYEGNQLAIPLTSEYKYVMANEKWDWSTHIDYGITKVTKKANKYQLLTLDRIQLKVGKWILGCCDKTTNDLGRTGPRDTEI